MVDKKAKRAKVAVYRIGPLMGLHEGSFSDWDPYLISDEEYISPRAQALYDAMGVDLSDYKYKLCAHKKDGRWALFGLFIEGHRYAVEER